MSRKLKQQGVTSIFVVIFATLLFSIITLSFAGLMSRDQRRSSDDELSRSAYDSAMAGVEDAKRVIMAARNNNASAAAAIDAGRCDTIQAAGFAEGPEVTVQSSSSGTGDTLNQAYTCVKISNLSPNVRLMLDEQKSEIVPLFAADEFNRVRIEWHPMQPSITYPCGATDVGSVNTDALCPDASWGESETTPAMLRVQSITPGDTLDLNELNDAAAGTSVFLYPGGTGAAIDFGAQERFVDAYNETPGLEFMNRARGVECSVSAIGADYTCSTEIDLGSTVSRRNPFALLRLTSIYKGSQVLVTLLMNSNPVNFDGVQPVVDSTGRANDLFRRVEARLSLTPVMNLPEAALDVAGPLCKDFYVTTSGSGPINPGVTCQP